MITTHTDHIGSLLRPPSLLKARQDLAAGRLRPAEFKRIEDAAVDEVVAGQEAAGVEVITDGELRRLSFQAQMTEAVEGFGQHDIDAFLWGEWRGDEHVGDLNLARPQALGVVSRLRRKRHLSAEEFVYLRGRSQRITKVTLPSPTLWANFWDPAVSAGAYATFDSFMADVVDILRDEVAELARLGAEYIQLDAPHYPLLLDPKTRAFYEQRGWSLQKWLHYGIEMDNAVMAAADITFGFHLCRGNQGSRWLVEGGYDLIAAPIFQHIRAHRLLLEYDDARSGSFAPLQQAPDDKIVVLGLVTTKSPRQETVAELSDRIRAASRYFPLERLAISPQCGFSTSVIGNAISVQDQWRKLQTIAETAQAVWG